MTGSTEFTSMEGSSYLLSLPDLSEKKACDLLRTCLGGNFSKTLNKRSLRSREVTVNFEKSSPVRKMELKESSEGLALALSEDFTPVPLCIYDADSVRERKSLRRSPRLCSQDVSSQEEVRPQFRLCPAAASGVLERESEDSKDFHMSDSKVVLLNCSEKHLRRLPRLIERERSSDQLKVSDSARMGACEKVKVCLAECESGILGKNWLRSREVTMYDDVKRKFDSGGNDDLPEQKIMVSKKKKISYLEEEETSLNLANERKSLRRYPRLCSSDVSSEKELGLRSKLCSSAAAGVSEGESEDFKDLLNCSKKHLRRSPRLRECEMSSDQLKISDSARMKERETVRPGLEGCELGILSKKWLTSQEVTIHYSVKRKYGSGGNADVSEQKILVSKKKKRSSLEEEEAGLNLVNEKCVRRSPRFVSGYDDGKCSSGTYPCKNIETSLQDSDMQILLEKCVRKSPRLCSSSGGNEGVKIEDNRREMSSSVEEESSAKSETNLDERSPKTLEEKLLRRFPRGLSSATIDDVEMKQLPKLKEQPAKETSEVFCSNEMKQGKQDSMLFFIGDPIPDEEARERWRWRYELKNRGVKGRSLMGNVDKEDELVLNVKCHYNRAQIGGSTFDLGDCAYVRGEEGQKHIGRIIEFFETTDEEDYCRIQWFYKASDTVVKDEASFHDNKRVFYSTIMNDNLLSCIISKVTVIQVTPQLNLKANPVPQSDYYYDMEYLLDYSTFRNLQSDNSANGLDLSSLRCADTILPVSSAPVLEDMPVSEPFNKELALLDIYSGCGAMSTGLCLGAKLSGVNLLTRWAVDSDFFACKSLRLNHPETQVRNETAEDFLELLKQWEQLCAKYGVKDGERAFQAKMEASTAITKDENSQDDIEVSTEELEVSSLVDICYGDPDESGKRGLKFKVRWEGYGPSDDTWEPIEGLSDCQELIQEFVTNGLKTKILPRPGDVDVLCGGPPCQGISGYNRFRSVDAPLDDDRNRQIVVFMDIVEFLKPKYVLMENVMDILRFDKASLGRYAISRLVHMHYQARVGIMAAGCYGLPQFRLRVFFWGALPSEDLPQFPLPTHDVVVRYWPPPEFERNVVAYDEGQPHDLQDAVLLHDAISDLPAVRNDESSDEMPYGEPPETEFQKFVRSTKLEMMGYASGISKAEEAVLYDHCPHQLFEDDYLRVCKIPQRKGANFRDLPGVVVGEDNVVRRDTTKDHELLPSGKPMVPDYALTFEQGKSKRPFGRLWWDETLPTIVTFPNCHSLKILHPEQDRVLTVRECARLQGFPDYYRFCGTVKKRYRQIGNAVAIPVGRALGYALGTASQKLIGKEPLMKLPPNFSYSNSL